MSAPVVTYERGTTYVTEGGTNATALVGQLYVGGTLICDTFERLDNHVNMPEGIYHRSSMYIDPTRGEVINPSLLSASGANHEYAGKKKAELKRLEEIKTPSAQNKQSILDLKRDLARMGQYANILFHAGSVPSHFEGCIGCGWIEAKKLTFSAEAMYYIYTLVGGKLVAAPIITVEVVGKIPAKASLKEFAG